MIEHQTFSATFRQIREDLLEKSQVMHIQTQRLYGPYVILKNLKTVLKNSL